MAVNVITSFIPIVDANGIPYADFRVFVCNVETTTLKNVYSDDDLLTAAANPIRGTAGRHPIRFLGAGTYKIQVEINGTDTIGSGTVLTNYSWDNIDPGVAVGSSALPVASGGTGATTAALARTNLAVAAASDMTTAQTNISTLQTRLGSNDRTRLAAGATADRPSVPAVGDIRWNSSTSRYESYDGATWYNIVTEEEAATQAQQEAASSTTTFTSPGRQHLHPSAAKMWAFVSVTAGSPSISASYNVTSVTDNGVGDFTLNLTTAFSTVNFATLTCLLNSSAAGQVDGAEVISQTASAIRIRTFSATASGNADKINTDNLSFYVVAFGDHA